MTSRVRPLDKQDVLYLQRKFRYAMEIVAESEKAGYLCTGATEYLVEKCGYLLGLGTYDKELEEATMRINK